MGRRTRRSGRRRVQVGAAGAGRWRQRAAAGRGGLRWLSAAAGAGRCGGGRWSSAAVAGAGRGASFAGVMEANCFESETMVRSDRSALPVRR